MLGVFDKIVLTLAGVLCILGMSEVMAGQCYKDANNVLHCKDESGEKTTVQRDTQGTVFIKNKEKTKILYEDSNGVIHIKEK